MRHWGAIALIVCAVALTNCTRKQAPIIKPKPTVFGTTVVESSGGKQIGRVGSQLSEPLVLQVNDENGNAVPGALVELSGTGGLILTPSFGLTDSNGQFSATIILGGTTARYTLTAITPAKTRRNPELNIEEIALGYEEQFGSELNSKYCVRCHNPESSQERVSNYDNLETKPHPFSDGDSLNKLSDTDLAAIISHGGPALNKSALMPPWGFTLTKSEIQALIAYIRMVSDPPYRATGTVYAKK